MNKLQKIIAYFCIYYPYPQDLSKSRLTKLVYLADWYSALADNKQLTNIEWIFNHYGPYVDDVINAACSSHDFSIINMENIYGSYTTLISYHGNENFLNLTSREKSILDLVINKTEGKYYNEFIDYVYSTYPVQSQNRYLSLDLVNLANDYRHRDR